MSTSFVYNKQRVQLVCTHSFSFLPRARSEPGGCALSISLGREVHLRAVRHGVLERVALRHVDGLLGLHRGLHHRVVGLERVAVVLVVGERRLLDAPVREKEHSENAEQL